MHVPSSLHCALGWCAGPGSLAGLEVLEKLLYFCTLTLFMARVKCSINVCVGYLSNIIWVLKYIIFWSTFPPQGYQETVTFVFKSRFGIMSTEFSCLPPQPIKKEVVSFFLNYSFSYQCCLKKNAIKSSKIFDRDICLVCLACIYSFYFGLPPLSYSLGVTARLCTPQCVLVLWHVKQSGLVT